MTLDRSGNLEDAAYAKMRQALIDGRFSPGQTFTIRALAQAFGTSPMPARDALKRLVAERGLDLLPNRSVIVPMMSRARFQEILQMRLSLEPMITVRAVALITPPVIEAMGDDHRSMCEAVEAGDAVRFLSSNRSFHFRLYEAARTSVMQSVIEGLWVQIGPYLNQVFRSRDTGSIRKADHHHTQVLKALRRQDGPAAAQAIWSDLADAADAILAANLFSETSSRGHDTRPANARRRSSDRVTEGGTERRSSRRPYGPEGRKHEPDRGGEES